MSDISTQTKPERIVPIQPEPLWTRPFILLTLCYFLLFLSLQMLLSPFPAYVTERFNPGDVKVSLTTTLFALAAIAARFATAALMKAISRHLLLYAGLILTVICTAAYPFANSYAVLLALRIGFGIGFGMGSTIMATMVSHIIPPQRMGEGIGYFGLSTSLAMSLGPLAGLSLLDHYGFLSLSMWGTLAISLIFPLLMGIGLRQARIARTSQASSADKKSLAGSGKKQAAAESNPQAGLPGKNGRERRSILFILPPAFLNMVMAVTYGGLLAFLALYGIERELEAIGLFFLFNALTILGVRPIAGKLFDRKGHGAVLIPGSLFLAGSLLILSFADQMLLLVLSALLYGLGMGSVQPTLQAWMLKESDPARYGTTNSLFYNSTDLGIAVGSLCLGVIASASSYAFMYRCSSFLMLGFLILYGVIRLILSRNNKKRSAIGTAS
ncbi:MFS transporter [Paenibacillus senegalensis]|uniref:MFS transporter n=1 Tax=Paenibacillus senegalensis TaxID=1465766 RepID=UPI0002888336|nr:MFS transporter [Paenibacillus senegalensis]